LNIEYSTLNMASCLQPSALDLLLSVILGFFAYSVEMAIINGKCAFFRRCNLNEKF
jgi:hypothetical protein